MTSVTENRVDLAATVVSLAAEATELRTRVHELRRELVDLDERMAAISQALRRFPSSTTTSHTAASR
ncbi:hypothetical protein [Streptomyces sp. NPDC050263]|uniref:hypothetical protein n=1 Tax=Streptomyces sp. NPDC050263 TaxID=3155037 RepID=UPI003440C06A